MRNKTLIERNKILELEARYDPLSGLLNRRGTEEALQQFTERHFATRFLIALLDIDNFKRINDRFGHAIGDQVIHEFSNCLANSTTAPAKIGRWGGEEFLIVYDIHDESEMDIIGKTLVEEIRRLNWDHIHKGLKVTASVGLSMWTKGDSLDNAVRIADDMLYDVKHHGRDNWRCWPVEEAA
jgi:diguanylate cyclase (GGDEF)-like protein